MLKYHCNVTLCVDFFFVQGHNFLPKILRGIGYRTVNEGHDCKETTILSKLTAFVKLYTSRGLVVRNLHLDHKFECIREQLRLLEVSAVLANSHVGEVEISIRTIMECLCSCAHGLLYKWLPKILVTSMVTNVVRHFPQFPRKMVSCPPTVHLL